MSEGSASRSLWILILPWLVAALAGSMVPIVLALVDNLLPTPFWPRMPAYPIGFGPAYPLGKKASAFVGLAGLVFWAVGLALSSRGFQVKAGWRQAAYHLLVMMGIAGSLFVIPLLSAIWSLAIPEGYASFPAWGLHEGNHGPWRHAYDLRKVLSRTLLLPYYACVLGLVGTSLKPSRVPLLVSAGSAVVFLALLGSHYWLID